jgi:hypothetical protein
MQGHTAELLTAARRSCLPEPTQISKSQGTCCCCCRCRSREAASQPRTDLSAPAAAAAAAAAAAGAGAAAPAAAAAAHLWVGQLVAGDEGQQCDGLACASGHLQESESAEPNSSITCSML